MRKIRINQLEHREQRGREQRTLARVGKVVLIN